MFNDLGPLIGETERTPRQAAYALVNIDLQILTDSVDIKNWTGVRRDSLLGCPLVELFPELLGHEDGIQQLVYNPGDCFILPKIHRRSVDKREHYFDLQIVAARDLGPALLLIVIDVTQQVLVSNRLQEIKNIPALKTTPEEIRQNLDALERWNRALFLLNQAGQALTATLEKQQVLQQLLKVAVELIGAEGSSVWLWDEVEPDYLICEASFNIGQKPPLVEQRLHVGQGLAGWVAETGKSVSIISAEDDPRFSPDVDAQSGFNTISLVVVPLRLRDEVIGVLEVVNKLEGEFEAEDVVMAETLAASASTAIDNARLVEALQSQTEDLRARNEELDAFAHTVAHDLQNPLAQIIGFSELLLWDDGDVNQEDKEMSLQLITNNAQKMSTIVRELLVLSSIRKSEVKVKPIMMREIVESAIERLAIMIKEHEVELSVPDEWPLALGHAPWIEEIWENYLSNAIKYGGTPPLIELGGTAQPDGTVKYWVRDNGPGINSEDQAELFTPFTQLGDTGHGLGLSIVRRIANKLNGQVGVESKEGEGSIFSFTLPGVDE